MTLALALANGAKTQPFNSTYYATCATLIPVLYLALVVQGNAFTNMLRSAHAIRATAWRRRKLGGPWRALRVWALVIFMTATIIAVIGVLAEWVAVTDLLLEASTHRDDLLVLGTVLVMVAAVAVGPFRLAWQAGAPPKRESKDEVPADVRVAAGLLSRRSGQDWRSTGREAATTDSDGSRSA